MQKNNAIKLTELQKEFINLLDLKLQINLDQIGMEREKLPDFQSLFEVEEKLTEIKKEFGFRDTTDEEFKEALPL